MMIRYNEGKRLESRLIKALRKPRDIEDTYYIKRAMQEKAKETINTIIKERNINSYQELQDFGDVVEYTAHELAFKVTAKDYTEERIPYCKVNSLILAYNEVVDEFCWDHSDNDKQYQLRRDNYQIESFEDDTYFTIGDYNFLKE